MNQESYFTIKFNFVAFINIALRDIRLAYSYPKIFDYFVIITKFHGQYNFFPLVTPEREKYLKGIRYNKGLLGFKFLCSLVHSTKYKLERREK